MARQNGRSNRSEVVVARVTGSTAQVLQAVRRGDSLEVLRSGTAEVAPGDSGAQALVDALNRAGIRERRVVLCLSGRSVLLRRVELPPASPEQLPQLVLFEAQRHLPLPVDQLATGYRVLPRETVAGANGAGPDTEVLLAVTRRSELARLERALAAEGLRAEAYCAAPLAVADGWLPGVDHPPTATAGPWLLLAEDDGGIVAQVIRGERPLVTRFTPASRESWAAELRRWLAAQALQHPEDTPRECVVTGELEPLAVGMSLGLPCRSVGTLPPGLGEPLPGDRAALIGAARQLLCLGRYPAWIEPQARMDAARSQGRSRAALLTAAALGIAVLLGVWQFDRQQRGAADAQEAERLRKQVASDRKLLGELRKRRDALREQWSAVGSATEAVEAPPLELLRRAAATAPAGVWLTEMSYEAGEPLRLQGTAREEASVGRWLRSLESSAGFASVGLGFVRSADVAGMPVTQFRIDCTLDDASSDLDRSDRLARVPGGATR